jgi:hypothetical protein
LALSFGLGCPLGGSFFCGPTSGLFGTALGFALPRGLFCDPLGFCDSFCFCGALRLSDARRAAASSAAR